jgi:hypothetical protein
LKIFAVKTLTGMALMLVASASAFTPGSAYAQQGGESKTPMQIIDEGRANERLQVEKQYEAIKSREAREPAKGGKFDPWANARSADVTTQAPKGAASKTSASKTAKSEARKGGKKNGGSAPLPLR